MSAAWCERCGDALDDDDEIVITFVDATLDASEEYTICSTCAIVARDTWFPRARTAEDDAP